MTTTRSPTPDIYLPAPDWPSRPSLSRGASLKHRREGNVNEPRVKVTTGTADVSMPEGIVFNQREIILFVILEPAQPSSSEP